MCNLYDKESSINWPITVGSRCHKLILELHNYAMLKQSTLIGQ